MSSFCWLASRTVWQRPWVRWCCHHFFVVLAQAATRQLPCAQVLQVEEGRERQFAPVFPRTLKNNSICRHIEYNSAISRALSFMLFVIRIVTSSGDDNPHHHPQAGVPEPRPREIPLESRLQIGDHGETPCSTGENIMIWSF